MTEVLAGALHTPLLDEDEWLDETPNSVDLVIEVWGPLSSPDAIRAEEAAKSAAKLLEETFGYDAIVVFKPTSLTMSFDPLVMSREPVIAINGTTVVEGKVPSPDEIVTAALMNLMGEDVSVGHGELLVPRGGRGGDGAAAAAMA